MFNFIKKNKLFSIFVLIILFMLTVVLMETFDQQNFLAPTKDQSFEKIRDIFLIISAIAVPLIAWYQLDKFNKTNTADFLMRVENRYGSDEILQARNLINLIKIKVEYRCTDPESVERIQNEILSYYKNTAESEDFMLLYNFLEFLESISYYEHRGYIATDDVYEMFSGISLFYKMYENMISEMQKDCGDNDLFCEVKNLSQKFEMKRKGDKHCWVCSCE